MSQQARMQYANTPAEFPKCQASIVSLTIAYNGEHLLQSHLDALLRQTRPLDEVVVINNASKDRTLQLLSARYPQVTVLNLPENVGVGGAYAVGFDYALNSKRHDWVWLFDQDSIPRTNGLERLIAGLQELGSDSSDVAILAPSSVNTKTQLNYPGLLWRQGWRKVPVNPDNGRISFVDAVISSGSLVRCDAVRKAGVPRADFFIDYVDFEHCLRLRSHGFRIGLVNDSVLEHTMGTPRKVGFGPFSRSWADHDPWREYYRARNEIVMIWSYDPSWRSKLSVIRSQLRHAIGILLFGKEKIACVAMMYRGVMDGLAGRLGITPLRKTGSPQ